VALELYELALRFKSEGFPAMAKQLDTVDKKGQGVAKAFSALKATLVTGAIAGFVRKIAIESIDAQKNAAQLNAVLKSTGGIAGVSAGEIDELASSLQRTTTYGDDAVKSAASLLLTFTNIRGEVFKNTLPAITDLATAMGQDLNQSAIQVGKALNDPIKGVTALQRVGVSFSESQKAVIKNLVETNRLAEAQGVILKELNVQFGGSAEAARNTLGGALTALGNSWDDLFEVTQDSSSGIIGAINSITDNLPEVRRKFDSFFTGMKNGFTGLVIGYKQDAADIARVLAFLNEVDAKVFRSKEQAAIAARQRADAARLDAEIANMRREAGGGLFGDVSGSGSTVVRTPKATPPLSSGGGGTGKGPKIPSFDFSGTAQAQLDSIGAGLFADNPFAHDSSNDGPGMSSDALKEVLEKYKKNREWLTDEQIRIEEEETAKLKQATEDRADWMASTIGDAMQNGIIAAFQGEGVSGAIKAFGKTILAAIGDMMVQKGTAMLAEGLIMSGLVPFLSNPFTAGPALLAAGAALVALGSTLGAISTGGARGSSRAGGFRDAVNGADTTRLKFVDRNGMAASLNPMQPMVFNVIGEDDARAQRIIGNIVRKNSRRQA
jgi:hypothetical protein